MRHILLALLLLFPFSAWATGDYGLGGGAGLVYSGTWTPATGGVRTQDSSDDVWIGGATCGASPFCFDTSEEKLTVNVLAIPAKDVTSNPGLNVFTLHSNDNYPAAPTSPDVRLFAMSNGEVYKMDSADSYPLLLSTERCMSWRIDGQGAETDAWWSPSAVPRKFTVHHSSATHWEAIRSGLCHTRGTSTTTTIALRACAIPGCTTATNTIVTAGAACVNDGAGSTLTFADRNISPTLKYIELQVTVPNASGTVQEVSVNVCFDSL